MVLVNVTDVGPQPRVEDGQATEGEPTAFFVNLLGTEQNISLYSFDLDKDDVYEIESTTLLTPPAHEPGVLPAWLAEQGAGVIIAGGMGNRAQDLFRQNDIDVVVGAPDAEPQQLVRDYLAGRLKCGQNICDH